MRVTRLASWTALVLISVVGFCIHQPIAQAEDVSITAIVPDLSGPPPNPIVELSGVAAPSATVTVARNGTDQETLTADSSAGFDFLMNEQPTGQQTYEIRAVDTDGRNLAPLTLALNLAAGATTSISNIFLGPSIALSDVSLSLGDTAVVRGQTYPGSAVTVLVATTPAQIYSGSADLTGRWQVSIPSNDLGTGTFSLVAITHSSITGDSELSASVTLTITALTPPTNTNINTNTSPTNRNTNTPRPPVDPFAGKPRADLNGDGRVNLIDLSILLFYWQQRNPANDRADISNEGLVGMVDFSIMLFQWTG